MNRHHGYSILLSAVIVLTLAGCSKGESPPENKTSGGTAKGASMVEKKGFDVYNQEGRKVLWVSDQPGALLSTALRPPGYKPPPHPFLSGRALWPNEESRLKDILDKSENFKDFVGNLRKNGYKVVAKK